MLRLALGAIIAVWLAFWFSTLIVMVMTTGVIGLMRRPVLIIVLLLAAIGVTAARANERAPQTPSCWQIALWRTAYGDEAVKQAARARGATEAQIRDAERRCSRNR